MTTTTPDENPNGMEAAQLTMVAPDHGAETCETLEEDIQLYKRLGIAIRQRRMHARLSQVDMAKAAKISRSYYAQIERGQRNMSVQCLRNVARALGTSAIVLMQQAELPQS